MVTLKSEQLWKSGHKKSCERITTKHLLSKAFHFTLVLSSPSLNAITQLLAWAIDHLYKNISYLQATGKSIYGKVSSNKSLRMKCQVAN